MMQFDRQALAAFIIVCLMLTAGRAGLNWTVSELKIFLDKEPVQLREPLTTIPRMLGRWQALDIDRPYDDAILEELGTRQFLDRTYALEGRPELGLMNIHVAYYTGMIDAVPHVPDRCLVAAGFNAKSLPHNFELPVDRSSWITNPKNTHGVTNLPYQAVVVRHDFTGQERLVRMPIGNLQLRVVEFERQNQPGQNIFGGYFFIANGRTTPTPLGVRKMAFNPRERHAYYCKVQFMYGSRNVSAEEFVNLVAELLKDFLPELMRRLPDWAEIERLGNTNEVESELN